MKVPEIKACDVVIFHDPCSDGFTAAWAAWKKFPNAEFLPGSHEKNKGSFDYWAGKLAGKHVLVVDFSFGREMTEKLAAISASYTVLDHHITSKEALGDLPYCYFDMTRSGALITWETLHGVGTAPSLVKYVSDRDIWKNELLKTNEVNTVIHRMEHTFEKWDKLEKALSDGAGWAKLVEAGRAMLEYQAGLIRDIAKRAVVWKIAGVEFLTANCPAIATEICDLLGEGQEFKKAAAFEVMGDVVKWSLRSVGDYSVGDIAKKFPGGGGHRNASGFSVPVGKIDWVNRVLNP